MSEVTTSTPASSTTTAASSSRNLTTTRGAGAQLVSEQGKISIADSVVEKIAGLAARSVSGVHAMGGKAGKTLSTIKSALPIGSDQPSPTQGVKVEVGERQAAVDLDLVVEYGVPIVDVASAVRQNVINQVQTMTGLEVTEVNVSVNDVYVGGDEQPQEPPRVQ